MRHKLYSQLDDELYIEKYFQKHSTGRFLDIGAYDGISYSNVYPLVLKYWSGVSLEPEETSYNNLVNNYKEFPKIKCIKKGLGLIDATVKFYDSNGGAISTTEEKHKTIWEKVATFKETEIELISWNTLLETHGDDFNLVNIDTEGNSVELFKAIPVDRLTKLEMVVVEHDNRAEEITIPGFTIYHHNALNIILVRK